MSAASRPAKAPSSSRFDPGQLRSATAECGGEKDGMPPCRGSSTLRVARVGRQRKVSRSGRRVRRPAVEPPCTRKPPLAGAASGRRRARRCGQRVAASLAPCRAAELAPLPWHGYAAVSYEEQRSQLDGARPAHRSPPSIRPRHPCGPRVRPGSACRASRHRLLRRPVRHFLRCLALVSSRASFDECSGHFAQVAGRDDRHSVDEPCSESGARSNHR